MPHNALTLLEILRDLLLGAAAGLAGFLLLATKRGA